MRIRGTTSSIVAVGLVVMHTYFIAVPSVAAAFSMPKASSETGRHVWNRPVRLYLRAVEAVTSASNDGRSTQSPNQQRRRVVSGMANTILAVALASASIGLGPASSHAAGYVPGTVWRTGKPPQVPGQKPRDKSDTKGTRKDTGFLRSIADCKAQCERSGGADGLARSKEDCLSECQDVCCETYEQCTFAIVPRI